MLKKVFFMAALAAAPAVSAQAERALSWEDCSAIALKSNPALANYSYSLDAAQYDYRTALNAYYPAFNLSYDASRSGGAAKDSTSSSLSFGATEKLLNLGTRAAVKTKKASVEQARQNLRYNSAEQRYSLFSAFAGMLYSQQYVNLAATIYEIRKNDAAMVGLQYEGGRESKGNKMRTEAQAEQAKAEVTNAKRSLEAARRSLLAALGQDEYDVISATGSLAAPSLPETESADDLAAASPQVAAAKAGLSVTESSLDSAKSDVYPTLSASQSLGWSGADLSPDRRNWSLGFSLSLPLFSNGPTYHRNNLAAAKSKISAARESYRQTLLSVKSSAQQAVSDFEAAYDDLRVQNLFLEAAKQRYGEAQIQYMAGSLSFEDWQTAEQNLVSYEQSYLSALKKANLAKADLDRISGLPLGK